jgi:L-threonylcarbamoyladenylate synthase
MSGPPTITVGPPAGFAAPEVVARAAGVLRAGHIVVLPTDTVYGLAALPSMTGATETLFALKGRGTDVPLAVLCATTTQALGLAEPAAVSDAVRRIAERLWPGPLTLVLPRRPGLGYALGEPAATIGVRCPDHTLVRALAAEVGPLATTSANRHGEPTPPTAAEAAATFGAGVGLVLDGGPCTGAPSTVVEATGEAPRRATDGATGTAATGGGARGSWRLLREGALSLADVEAAAAE